jgi:hypothetical protein
MKTKHRKIIALQANAMHKVLKKVKPFRIDKNDEYDDEVTLWQNQVSMSCSKTAMSFKKAKLARLFRVTSIDYKYPFEQPIYGNFFSVKSIIVASINFDHFKRLQDNADAGYKKSEAEVIGLSFFHKARIEYDQKVSCIAQ